MKVLKPCKETRARHEASCGRGITNGLRMAQPSQSLNERSL